MSVGRSLSKISFTTFGSAAFSKADCTTSFIIRSKSSLVPGASTTSLVVPAKLVFAVADTVLSIPNSSFSHPSILVHDRSDNTW